METNLMGVLLAPLLDPGDGGILLQRRTGAYLLLAFGTLLLGLATLARWQRRKTGDDALRLVEAILVFFAGVCFAIAQRWLEE